MTVFSFLKRFTPKRGDVASSSRILEQEKAPKLVYAIGDIHGCSDKLAALEAEIAADAAARKSDGVIVVLGDLVDRGPDSRAVIDRLISEPPKGLARIVLAGNHDALMADFLKKPRQDHDWLSMGGVETLESYGIDVGKWHRENADPDRIGRDVREAIPEAHRKYVAELLHLVRFGRLIFVHAGIDRTRPLAKQDAHEFLWIRHARETDALAGGPDDLFEGHLVVHGHTPLKQPLVLEHRIDLDTCAYAGGPLTAARFVKGQFDGLLSANL